MQIDLFDYDLPPELIAQHPPAERSGGRLLRLHGDACHDLMITDLVDLVNENDLMVFNDTRVVPARLVGRKLPGGGRIEILLERVVGPGEALVQIGTSKTVRKGLRFAVGEVEGEVIDIVNGFFRVRFATDDALAVFENLGKVPLPPYIHRADDDSDRERYQTLFAAEPGAVAAPTAGLHFDRALLDALDRRGVRRATLTLHVGSGTFRPVRAERVEDHRMHAEHYRIGEDVAAAVEDVRARGGRVIAVGTTVTRALESAAASAGRVRPQAAATDIFIYPGYRFAVVDALVTNFHLPRSTLIMMVSAFAGRERVLAAYRHAVAGGYRFYSYGDAMFVERAS